MTCQNDVWNRYVADNLTAMDWRRGVMSIEKPQIDGWLAGVD